MSYQIKRLEKLSLLCGVSTDGKNVKKEPEVDTSKMTAYEKGQFKLASDMKRVRENISELDNLGDKASATRKTELSNAIRKDLMSLKKDAVEVKKAAHKEDRRTEYETLLSHVKKTEQLYKSRFMKMDDSPAIPAGGGATKLNNLDKEMDDLNHPMVSLRDDEEFQQFFAQVQANDAKMDQALDRISAGVTRLHENALGIKSELQVQKTTSRRHNVEGFQRQL